MGESETLRDGRRSVEGIAQAHTFWLVNLNFLCEHVKWLWTGKLYSIPVGFSGHMECEMTFLLRDQ